MQPIVHLRKAIVGRQSVRIVASGFGDSVMLDHAGLAFYGSKDRIVANLRAAFEMPQARVERLEPHLTGHETVDHISALVAAVNGFTPSDRLRQSLEALAGRLPPVAVKYAPLHRMGLLEVAPYLQLHRESLMRGDVRIHPWLAQAKDASELAGRLRAFLLCFCLGLIVRARPDAGRSKSEQQGPRRSSVLARIIDRIRGL